MQHSTTTITLTDPEWRRVSAALRFGGAAGPELRAAAKDLADIIDEELAPIPLEGLSYDAQIEELEEQIDSLRTHNDMMDSAITERDKTIRELQDRLRRIFDAVN